MTTVATPVFDKRNVRYFSIFTFENFYAFDLMLTFKNRNDVFSVSLSEKTFVNSKIVM